MESQSYDDDDDDDDDSLRKTIHFVSLAAHEDACVTSAPANSLSALAEHQRACSPAAGPGLHLPLGGRACP